MTKQPCHRVSQPLEAPPEEPARPAVLVVDDDASVRHTLSVVFEGSFKVHQAATGPSALHVLENHPVDVVILDLRMPGMSGIDVLRAIKQISPSVEVLILTAFESLETATQAIRLGACDYLSKPCELDQLRKSVGMALERQAIARKTQGYDKKLAELMEEVESRHIKEEVAQTRSEILASIIHDLNGPLTSIAGYVDLLSHEIRHSLLVEGEQLGRVRSNVQTLSRQITNCIEITRRYVSILHNTHRAEFQTNLKDAFEELREAIAAQRGGAARRLKLGAPPPILIEINPIDLVQILTNLVKNALQSREDNSAEVEVTARFGDELSGRQLFANSEFGRLLRSPDFSTEKPFLLLGVHDNGPGIPLERLGKIFEPYFTTKAPGKGTGLGLAIVRRLVFQAKGAIHVYSHVGEGTMFTVMLPLA